MKVAIIWHSAYPWDIRIEKFCGSIRASNHEVVVISGGKRGLPRRETCGGADVERISFRIPVLGRIFSLAMPFNPFWILAATKIVRREKARMVIVRDLPLALPFALLAPFLKVPVILDMAENYPAALLAYRKKIYAPFLFANGWLPRMYEKLSLRRLSHVIVVAEEQKKRLTATGYPDGKVTIVGNTPDCAFLERAGETGGAEGGKNYILYSGFMDPHRGIRTLILAFNEIKDEFADYRLVLIGKGSEDRALRRLVEDCRLEGRVDFKGWVDFRRIPAYIKNSALCVIPHLKTEHTDTTMPNKIYDYLYFGKPVVVSSAEPLKRMMREFRCGAVFASGDYRDLGRALRAQLRRPPSPKDALRGKRLVETKYNWMKDGGVLMRLIERYGY